MRRNTQQDILETFSTVGIKVASPEKIIEWSRGEVTKPETINYRTQRSEKTVYLMNVFLVLNVTLNVIVENTKVFVIRALSAKNAELK